MSIVRTFGLLFGISILALVLALPQPLDPLLVGVGSVTLALVIGLGLRTAAPFGKGAPLLDRLVRGESLLPVQGKALLLATASGALLGGSLLLVLILILAPLDPTVSTRLAAQVNQPAWRPWIVAFEAAVLEELLFRLFLMSVTLWGLNKVWRPRTEEPRPALVGIALVMSALSFAGAHLPAWFAIVEPTVGLIIVVVLLNGLAGLVLGQIYWQWGIEAAILCHFAADLVVQGLGPRLLGT
jgi:hypothetical protein